MKQAIKVLYFFPHPIVNRNHGNVTRAIQLLEYFISRNMDVDFVTAEHDEIEDEQGSLQQMFPEINAFFLGRKGAKDNYFKYFFNAKIPSIIDRKRQEKYHRYIASEISHFAKQQFNNLLKKKKYDVIIISYVYSAALIRDNPYVGNARLVIDTHDFMTAQCKHNKKFQLGASFEEEINIIKQFHESWSISSDELYVFSQFVPTVKHCFVPVMFKNNVADIDKGSVNFDLIYISSINPHNQAAAKWFFSHVYPLLSKSIRICVIGGITNFIPPDLPNVTSIPFAKDLKEYYHQSRIAICPMLEGTGIKVKVVEALSFGLPVVCTLRGLDGLPQKKDNGCLLAGTEAEFANGIIRLISDDLFYEKKRKEGIEMFEKYFLESSIYEELDTIFNQHTPAQ
ncbi:glycosyltransferase [Niabella sp.]|uniref:glycosyltransferase n=1 Tax=Niabella sp. TaxID=1962976 RepID=UPI00262C105B|nr:glycosyltransferase [Niabella sp.]